MTTTNVTAEQVKALRDATGAGMMDCKRALEEAGGDVQRATEILRERGLASAKKRAGRTATQGRIEAYVHHNATVGVLVEVNCETDFVARTPEFQALVKDLAMQIAATNPLAVTPEEIPAEVVERERAVFREQARKEGKPEHLWDRIVEGRLKKFYQDNALLEQPFIKDPEKTVGQLVTEVSARTGENIRVRRFVRYALGE